MRDERETVTGGRPTSASPSSEWMPARGPTISKRRGTTSIWTSSLRSSRIVCEQLVVACVGEGDDHALDVEQRDDVREPLGRPDHGEVVELRPSVARVRVHEADEIDAVLGVLQELPGRELPDVAGAEDDRVLEIRRAPSRCRTSEGTRGRDEDGREQPEVDKTSNVWVAHARSPGGDEVEPRAEGDEMEDTDHLVDGRVVDLLLVALVQPAELGGDDPERNHHQHDADLDARMGIAARPGRYELGQKERQQQGGDVGAEERAAHEPAAPPHAEIARPSQAVPAPGGRKCAPRRQGGVELAAGHLMPPAQTRAPGSPGAVASRREFARPTGSSHSSRAVRTSLPVYESRSGVSARPDQSSEYPSMGRG